MDVSFDLEGALSTAGSIANSLLYPAALALSIYIAFRIWWDGIARFFDRFR